MKKWQISLIAIVVCLPALWPLFHGQFFHMHDWTHVARLVEMDQALRDGHFPVRWSKDLGWGYGLPQFNFYAPLFYLWAEIFYLAGVSAIGSIKAVVILNYLISFGAMYAWASRIFNRYAGILAATAFIYIPYRAVDTYVRGAFAELTAITFIALTLALISRWQAKKTVSKAVWAACAWSGIWLSHNITGMISFPFMVLVLLGIVWVSRKKKAAAIHAGLIIGLSLGLAAFYIIPMAAENRYTMAHTLTSGFSDYRQHFLYLRQFIFSDWGYGGSIYGVHDDISFKVGEVHLIMIILTGIWLIVKRKRILKRQWVWLTLAGLSLVIAGLMSTFKTQFIWDAISYMKFIQFPWRFLTVMITFGSFLAGIWIAGFERQARMKQAGITITAGFALMGFNLSYFRPEKYLADNEALYYTDKGRIASQMSGIIPDFISQHSLSQPPLPPDQRFEIWPPTAEMTVEVDRTAEFLITTKTQAPADLNINILYFPGWKVYVNGKAATAEIKPGWPTMQVSLPAAAGTTVVSGIFEETPIRKAANLLTAVSLILAGYLVLAETKRRRING